MQFGALSYNDRFCYFHSKLVYGKWTSWSLWGKCDVTCDGGTQARTRSCVKTGDSDLDCIGDILQQQVCAVWDCPGKSCLLQSVFLGCLWLYNGDNSIT